MRHLLNLSANDPVTSVCNCHQNCRAKTLRHDDIVGCCCTFVNSVLDAAVSVSLCCRIHRRCPIVNRGSVAHSIRQILAREGFAATSQEMCQAGEFVV